MIESAPSQSSCSFRLAESIDTAARLTASYTTGFLLCDTFPHEGSADVLWYVRQLSCADSFGLPWPEVAL